MNYVAHYERLISRAMRRIRPEGYVEMHHVKPRCLGGDDSRENLVALTPEEHFVAHQLLVKIYPQVPQLAYAALMMTVGSQLAPRVKHTEDSKRARSEKLKGKPLSEETKIKLKLIWERRRVEKPMTDETKLKLRLASTGKKHTDETKAKLSEIRKANPVKRKVVADAA